MFAEREYFSIIGLKAFLRPQSAECIYNKTFICFCGEPISRPSKRQKVKEFHEGCNFWSISALSEIETFVVNVMAR